MAGREVDIVPEVTTALECSPSETGKIRREMPLGWWAGRPCSLIDPEKRHPTSPQICSRKAWGSSSSICNWLRPIRRVAPICTELGSAHRSGPPRNTTSECLDLDISMFTTRHIFDDMLLSSRTTLYIGHRNNNTTALHMKTNGCPLPGRLISEWQPPARRRQNSHQVEGRTTFFEI